MIIAVDFDGTIVEHRFPEIGNEIPFATTTLRMLAEQHNHRLILWTVRRGRLLEEAVEWCRKRGVEFYAVNKNFPEEMIEDNDCYGKINADLFIDDRNLGGIPDWGTIYKMITEKKDWKSIYGSINCENKTEEKKKKKRWLW
jgi:FMN phosphatase YigB (HAD superfamily)